MDAEAVTRSDREASLGDVWRRREGSRHYGDPAPHPVPSLPHAKKVPERAKTYVRRVVVLTYIFSQDQVSFCPYRNVRNLCGLLCKTCGDYTFFVLTPLESSGMCAHVRYVCGILCIFEG